MFIVNSRRARLLVCVAVVGGLVGCGLPRSGPSKREIFSGSIEQQGDAFIVPVNRNITRLTAVQPSLGFSGAFQSAGLVGSDVINAGDVLSLTIWENVDNGLLASSATGATPLSEMQVDGSGNIFVPYAGRIKAAGNTPDGLRQIITDKLSAQTPDPQVTVSRVAGDGSTVSVMGGVGGQGVYPITQPTRTLSAMLAKAGGVAIEPEIAQITVTRGGRSGKVWLKDLYRNPKMDIALRPGDVILVEKDQRSFTALGATGAQNRVPFETQELSAVEAIAQVGGLSTNFADPTGVFILRDESEGIARQVLGRPDLSGPQRIAYVISLTQPDGLFNARDFMIRDDDTVYVTEAPYVQWQKTLSVLTGSATSADALANAAGR
ncbi:polysaccharide biosynthesis/export family protein [Albidovulum sp.]|uniref:polysaccharide biosynthesis/export family protein n=1 Tax=Albidovulum sp. TaxID=1872424 RepID=UPI003D7E3B97